MDTGILALIIITAIRLFLPLSVFKWPLLGGLLAILGDISDVMTFETYGSGPLSDEYYHNYDKVFDIYYLFLEFLVARTWTDKLAKKTAQGLFIWRFAGFGLFELSTLLGHTVRPFFFLAPNIFENFYLAWLTIRKFKPEFVLTKKRLVIILLIVGIPKIIQESIMHWLLPDKTWYFFRDCLFWWAYDTADECPLNNLFK